jgi:hypothetical protein
MSEEIYSHHSKEPRGFRYWLHFFNQCFHTEIYWFRKSTFHVQASARNDGEDTLHLSFDVGLLAVYFVFDLPWLCRRRLFKFLIGDFGRSREFRLAVHHNHVWFTDGLSRKDWDQSDHSFKIPFLKSTC